MSKRQDAKGHYREALLLLAERSGEFFPLYDAGSLGRVRTLLERAIALDPTHARSHALLGYAWDCDEDSAERALESFRVAHRLDPHDREYEVYVLTLLNELGRESEALVAVEAAATRQSIDLQELRDALTAVGIPPDAGSLITNGFIHARNFFRSSLSREAERLRNRLEKGRAGRLAREDRERCAGDQRALRERFDADRVPDPIRSLAHWAERFGVGDDYCRRALLKRLSKAQRAKLIREVDQHAAAIQSWLDSFGDAVMPDEAEAFLYITLGVEEIRE